MDFSKGVAYCGNCFDLFHLVPDKSIQMVLIDLPYGTTDAEWDFTLSFPELWKVYKRVLTDNGVVVSFGVEPFSSLARVSNLDWFRYDWIWDKVTAKGHLVAKKRPLQQHEIISVFYDKRTKYNPQMVDRPKDKIRSSGEYGSTELVRGSGNRGYRKVYDKWYPKTIITVSNAVTSKSIHSTQKPVPLYEYLIKTYTDVGDVVLDHCSGSGTAAIACTNLDRPYILMEKDKHMFDLSVTRIMDYEKG